MAVWVLGTPWLTVLKEVWLLRLPGLQFTAWVTVESHVKKVYSLEQAS